MEKKKRMSKLKIIVVALIGIFVVSGVGIHLYFSLGTRIVYGVDGLENLDPNDTRPVEVRWEKEDIEAMTEEERKELGIPDDMLKEILDN